MKDIINWRALSRLLTGNEDKVRSSRIPRRQEAAVKELNDLLEYWKKRYNID